MTDVKWRYQIMSIDHNMQLQMIVIEFMYVL